MAAMKAKIDVSEHKHRVLYEIPFDSDRKSMSMIVREPNGTSVVYTKGAPK